MSYGQWVYKSIWVKPLEFHTEGSTHVTASVLDGSIYQPREIVLEIKNMGEFEVLLKYQDPIAQVYFMQLTEPVEQNEQPQYLMLHLEQSNRVLWMY
jgi:hypothetical protein